MTELDAREGEFPIRYPCSFAQERLAAAWLARPNDPAQYASLRWRIRGELNHDVLEAAWRVLVARHEILRTRFVANEDGFEAIVEASVPIRVSIVDCSALDPAIVDGEIAHIASADSRSPFEMRKAPLIRVTRLVLSATDSVLLVTAHQLVCDGWSFGLLARELGIICAAIIAGVPVDLPRLTTQFGDFARWQREALTEGALDEEYRLLSADFSGSFAVDVVTDFPRPVQWSSNVATITRALDSVATERFLDEARGIGNTAFMATLAATTMALRTIVADDALVVTTQVVNRDDVDLEGVVGPFVNTMPLRLNLERTSSLGTVLERVGETVANAFELRHVPFELVRDRILPFAGGDRGAPCGVNFIYQKAFTQDTDYGQFAIVSEHSRPGGAQYDLSVYVVERPGGWRLTCDYNPDLFEASTIGGILDRFEETVAGGIDVRNPVLFFHSDLFADGFYANEIASNISDLRIVPVGPHGIGKRPMLPTIGAMAADYMGTLDSIQPTGPYRLIGFCAGALVAYEVARLLKARGETVEDVILINATAPVKAVFPFRDLVIRSVARNARLSARAREIVCYNIARFNRAMLVGPAASFGYIVNLVRSFLSRGSASVSKPTGETFVRSRGEAVSELSFAHIGAALTHVPNQFDGHVTLIWSDEQSNLTGEPTQGWHRLAESVTTIRMNGGHVAPLHELVGDLSSILSQVLQKSAPKGLS